MVVLIPLFAALILWRIYRWSQGKDDLSGIFPPIGMIFVGLATMVGNRNSPLYYLFLALGVISVVVGLVLMFRN